MMKKEFKIIPALDVTDLAVLERLLAKIGNHPFVYGFKLGFSLGLGFGIPRVVELIRKYSEKPVIYDHQKAGTDIPDTGTLFAETMQKGGVQEVIIFPQAGPNTEKAWIAALHERNLKVIVGGIMTHAGFLQSEGGFIDDGAPAAIYTSAIEAGVNSFVVPLTKSLPVTELLKNLSFPPNAEFYSPGFGHQGGNAGLFPLISRHYLIVGRSLIAAENPMEWLDKTQKELQEL
jgi:orotidine-5'-phosphate decarboxylase